MSAIFISYRRNDSKHAARIVRNTLVFEFGTDEVFHDYNSMAPGQDFISALEQKLNTCDAMVALIGPGWLKEADPKSGLRRIDDPDDFVRRELTTAIQRDIALTPLLLEGARMPQPETLPEPLAPLSRRQALTLTDARFDDDLRVGVNRLHWLVAQAEDARSRVRPTLSLLEPTEEAETNDETAPHWMRFVPRNAEREAWEAIAEGDDVEAFRQHRDAFPDGAFVDLATRRIDDLVWRDALYSQDLLKIASYLLDFPEGEHRGAARQLLDAIKRDRSTDRDGRPPRSQPA